ncbi:hypothetical protein BDW74DRAFT_21820 [Aspergillus multicolor]|uniref:uncharacterized protein n=1 Tax=Aspergillus multicolor TaxID=41759 RepID=UPI003CCDB719
MPDQYSFAALREFLERDLFGTGKLEGTVPLSLQHQHHDPGGSLSMDADEIVLFDERRDPSSLNTFNSRYWAEYTQYPPEGEAVRLKALTAKGLYETLEAERRGWGKSSPERRSIFIRDLSPLCALALILPVAVRYAPSLREFLSKYITSRAFFGVSMDYPIRPASTYTFEFHIPFFALRRSVTGTPTSQSHVNRRKGEFQASFSTCTGDEKEFFHEAQISVLLVGIDEWVWTLYCLVERHYSETGPEDVKKYIQSGMDAPSGQGINYSMPIWNPREYFLLVLSRRMSEVRSEWSNLVQTLETRFEFLEEDTFKGPSMEETPPTSDHNLKLTKDYTWAIEVLQLFSNQLIKTIEAWDEFSNKHLHILRPDETPADFLPKVPSYLESLDTDISELQFIYRTIVRRIGAFESKRSNILDTSALVEARASNSQADNIGLLTKVTVVCRRCCQSFGTFDSLGIYQL